MNEANDGDNAEELRRQEEQTKNKELLTKKLERVSDEQRQKYQTHVDNAIDAHGEASDEFKLGVAKTYLQGLPPREEALQIRDYNRLERNRAHSDNDCVNREMVQAKLAGRDQVGRDHPTQDQPTRKLPPQNQPTHEQPSPERADPMQGMRPTATQRDYTELKKTHEQVAQRLGAEVESPTAPLPKEQLEDMSKHFADVREAQNLERSPAELRELKDLADVQTKAMEQFDRVHGPEPSPQQKQQRELLDRQHLAERVGVEGRWLGQDLRRQQLPGAERYEQEGRRAHHSGRQFHHQRQNLKSDPVRDLARVVQKQDQQKQAELQQDAQRSGRTVTAGQRANAPENSRKAADRQERADRARKGTGKARNQMF